MMYKVLIVDDEVLLRAGLKTMIDWEKIGFTVVAEAANGEQGFEQYKKHDPDVVITDIKMPKRDGLWLIDQIRKEDKYVSILVLTCHDEFSYAREALKAGADDYILKSEVEDEEILGIMDKVRKNLDKQNQDRDINQTVSTNKNDLRRALFIDLKKVGFDIDEKLKERCDLIGLPFDDTQFVFASVSISDCQDDNESNTRQINQAVINILFNLLEDREIEYIFHHYHNEYHFMLSSAKLSVTEIKRIFISANQGAQQYFDRVLQIVYTDPFGASAQLNDQYKDFTDKTGVLFYLRECAFYLENTNNIHFEELNAFELKKKYSQLLLIDYIIQNNMESAREFMDELYKYFMQKMAHPSSVKLFFSDLVGNLFAHYRQLYEESSQKTRHESYHYQINNALSLKEVCGIMQDLLNSIVEEMRQFVQNNAKMLTNRAIGFIEEHYDQKISLKDVAENLNFSKHYLCSIFKKETGDNMSHYINRLRIEKAKLLLKKGSKIKEIFEEVGFSNQQYFSKVFKKMTGMTVLEYKDKTHQ